MDAVGLEARSRIRSLTEIVQEKLVANAASNINILDNRAEVSVVADVQRLRLRSGSGQHDGDLFATRSPDPKRNPVTLQADRAWSALGLSLRKRAEYQVQVSLRGQNRFALEGSGGPSNYIFVSRILVSVGRLTVGKVHRRSSYRKYRIDITFPFWQSLWAVTSSTDIRIRELFALAAAAQDEPELKRVARQLRAALTEHVRSGPTAMSPAVPSSIAHRSLRPSLVRHRSRAAS